MWQIHAPNAYSESIAPNRQPGSRTVTAGAERGLSWTEDNHGCLGHPVPTRRVELVPVRTMPSR